MQKFEISKQKMDFGDKEWKPAIVIKQPTIITETMKKLLSSFPEFDLWLASQPENDRGQYFEQRFGIRLIFHAMFEVNFSFPFLDTHNP